MSGRGAAEWDVAILGGGLAGLSLAMRLADLPHLRTLVIEPRTEYPRDRTWCCWKLVPHPFGEAVGARWTRWEVLRAGPGAAPERFVQEAPDLPYEMIPADRLYDLARRRLDAAPSVELRLGTRVLALEEGPDLVRIDTDRGTATAGTVFDSRPPTARPGTLAQRFLGQEVTAARPVFTPGCLTLMDFAVESLPGAVRFLYVLPTSPREALVEDTWLAPVQMPLPDHRAAIRDYLAARYGLTDYAVGFEEEGAIPMDAELAPPRRSGRVIPIGTAGGAVKPSSGYGFLPIQRQAEALAADLAAGRPARPWQPRSGTMRWMDSVFLRALRDHPEEAPLLFGSLFAHCPPDALLRFLNDLGTPADIGRVIAAMPKQTMIRAAFAGSFVK